MPCLVESKSTHRTGKSSQVGLAAIRQTVVQAYTTANVLSVVYTLSPGLTVNPLPACLNNWKEGRTLACHSTDCDSPCLPCRRFAYLCLPKTHSFFLYPTAAGGAQRSDRGSAGSVGAGQGGGGGQGRRGRRRQALDRGARHRGVAGAAADAVQGGMRPQVSGKGRERGSREWAGFTNGRFATKASAPITGCGLKYNWDVPGR